jgi:LPXTG-motif cell wall-anchored protein
MKLRRAVVTAAATALIAPLALLSAPAAFATESGSPSPSSSETSASASPSASDTASASPSSSESTPDGQAATASQSQTSSGSPSSSSSQSSTATASSTPTEDEFNPDTDCKSFDLDEKITAKVSGLPNKIVAGSGWHNFTFVIDNNTGRDLEHVWVEAFAEYADDTDALLNDGLAELQVKEDGKWTDGYQDAYEEDGEEIRFTSSFVAVIDDLEKGDTATLDLRVKVGAKAPAGSAVTLTDAVYVGDNSDCHLNGDYYEFTILAPGSKPGDVDDAEPNGDKPNGSDTKAQGGAKEINGNLAETGSSSALPIIGLVGGVAVVAGAGAVFVARRRKGGSHS